MGRHKYSNEKITVYWDSDVCIHSAVCINNLGKVFDTKKKPWVNVDGASADEITKLIDTCPSGALSYDLADKKTTKNRKTEMDTEMVKVTVSKNGPYLMKGDFVIEDAEGNPLDSKKTVALCRCGQSSNKPFCDGTHRKVEFQGG